MDFFEPILGGMDMTSIVVEGEAKQAPKKSDNGEVAVSLPPIKPIRPSSFGIREGVRHPLENKIPGAGTGPTIPTLPPLGKAKIEGA